MVTRFPSRYQFNVTWANLDAWARRGIPAPPGKFLDVENGQYVRDALGNVIGGMRSPYVDVPASTWVGISTGAGFCAIAGHEVPFDEAQLHELYSSHGDYARKVAADAFKLVGDRYLELVDGLAIIEEAERSGVP